MTPASVEALVDEFGVACCMLYEECNATEAEALANIHDCLSVSRAALLAFIADKDAEMEKLGTQNAALSACNDMTTEENESLMAELADAVRARDSALEEAASACEDVAAKAQYSLTSLGAHDCAAAIRALACVVVPDSARTCQRGTKGCERNHL